MFSYWALCVCVCENALVSSGLGILFISFIIKQRNEFLFHDVSLLFSQVRSTTVEALGQMVGLITRTQLKMALPRLVPTILDM